jgi:hypothetical protein
MARRLSVVLLFTLAFLLPCAASEFLVAVIPLSEEASPLAQRVEESALRWGGMITETESRLQQWETRVAREHSREQALAIDRSYRSKAAGAVENTPELEGLPSQAAYTLLGPDTSRTALLESGDEGRQWYLHHRGYDALLLVGSERLDPFVRLWITAYDGEMTTLLDTLVQEPTTGLSLRTLEEAVLGWSTAGTAAGLVIEGGPSTLAVSLDNQQVEQIRSPIITGEGEHLVRLSAVMHHSREHTLTLAGGKIVELSAQLEEEVQPAITLVSKTGAVTWSHDGRSEGPSLWFTVEKPAYPTVIIASKEGFGDHLISLAQSPLSPVEVSLTPMSLHSKEYIDASQRDFYKQLRTTILLFGAYVGTLALSNTTQSPLYSSAQIVTSSLAMVSGVSLIAALGAYGAVSSK